MAKAIWKGRRPLAWTLASIVLFSWGCSSSGGGAAADYPSARLEGEVTLDGKPISSGTIQFVPKDANAPPVSAPILDGRYVATRVGLGQGVAILNVEPPARPEVITSEYQPPPSVTIPDRYKGGIPVNIEGDAADQDFALSSRK